MNCKVCHQPVVPPTVLPNMCAGCTDKATGLMTQETHGLGDKVAAAAKALGIRQKPGCGCGDRQKALNRLKLTGAPLAVARGFLNAIIDPPKENE
jgi:hypothetical protein